MKKIKMALVLLVMVLILSGCSRHKLTLDKETVEYGTDITQTELFKYQGNIVQPELSMEIDSKEVGTYKITATYKDETNTNDLKVVDSEIPQLEFNQDTTKVFEVPFESEYALKANIKKAVDKVDGEITEMSVVSKEEYEKIKKESETNKKELNDRVFNNDEELKKAKEVKKEKNSYIIIYSDINTKEAKEYQVNNLVIDSNFNINEVTYKTKVLEKGKEVSGDNLAIGSKNSDLKKSSNATVAIDKTESVKSVSTSNKVAKAALARVGQKFWCDELVSQALVDAGVLTGNSKVFPGGFLALSTYSSIGKSISRSQIQPGDILYYDDAGSGLKHVAVYVGNDKAVHGGSSGIKVVLGRVNIGKGPSKYYRMPEHFTWEDANKMVFGHTSSEMEGGNISNPGGANANIDVYTERTTTKDGQTFVIKGKNIDVDVLDNLIDQFFANKITNDTFVTKAKALGCTVDVIDPVISKDVWYERNVSTDQGSYIIKGTNINASTQDALDEIILEFMLENIDEATFYTQVKALGYTITKS